MNEHEVCEHCDQVMGVGNGCTKKMFVIKRKFYERIPYDRDGECHDCNVTKGQLHHPGCDMERCPACGGQSISCDC